jgi:hypothetical protein
MKSLKKGQDEYATFSRALKKVLSVSHSELQARIEADKQARKQRRKKLAAPKLVPPQK